MKENFSIRFLIIILSLTLILFFCSESINKVDDKTNGIEQKILSKLNEMERRNKINIKNINAILINHTKAIKGIYAKIDESKRKKH